MEKTIKRLRHHTGKHATRSKHANMKWEKKRDKTAAANESIISLLEI